MGQGQSRLVCHQVGCDVTLWETEEWLSVSLHFLLLNPATVFLELWKRERATVVTEWKLHEWDEDEVRTSSFLLGASLFKAGVTWT